MSALQELLDPLIDATYKGFPHGSAPLRRSEIGAQGWKLLAGDLPLPIAVIKGEALRHNLTWMQRYADGAGIGIAPHGKTTMSPQLFRQQLDAGAWGLTFANVHQLGIGVAAGARRCIVANQVYSDIDLDAIERLRRSHIPLRVLFLLDSPAQLELIEAWHAGQTGAAPFDVLLEIGVPGGRTGCRTHEAAVALAQRAHASDAVRLCGIECYEGLNATGESSADEAFTAALMQRVQAIAVHCDQQTLFDDAEVLVTAGGSAIFDLVTRHLKPPLARPVRALLRSGCYVTHDHGFYRRMVSAVTTRLRCADGLHAALEVWAGVQSLPEAGLAILTVGKRDISFDLDLPTPIAYCARGTSIVQSPPADWHVSALNDQHAYLRWREPSHPALKVGDMVALGISHPCTTFDKWRWLPVVDADYTVVDAVVTCF